MSLRQWLTGLPGRSDAALAALLFSIVAVLVVPLSPRVLDVLVIVSVAMGLGLLLVATRLTHPLELLTFPALLLISTMYRLSVNVASTKLVLIEGHAGAVIGAVGNSVVGGNLLAGVCVFLIVALVQFMVVAKGAERVAEVTARFSLDAMPGKQMSIDAELRAGSLTPDQARDQRKALDIESRLFGSMDGAMKFVKGDAIVGLVIAVVNVAGGLASGMLYRGMSARDALHRYTTLSIGDALVSQIPSLLVAIAAGLVITRVTHGGAESRSLGRQIVADLGVHSTVMIQIGAACIVLAAVPALPAIAFAPLGIGVMGVGLWAKRRASLAAVRGRDPSTAAPDRAEMPAFARTGAKAVPRLLNDDAASFDGGLRILLPATLVRTLDPGRLDSAVAATRRRLADAGHIGFPGLALTAVESPPGAVPRLVVVIQGVRWCDVPLPPDGLRTSGFDPMRRPVEGLPGYRIAADGPGQGLPLEEIVAGLVECACRQQAHRLVSLELIHDLMLRIRQDRPKLIEEIAPNIPLPRLAELVAALVAEGLPLRRLPALLDALLPMLPLEMPIADVVERMIVALAPLRCADLGEDTLEVFTVPERAMDALDPSSLAGTSTIAGVGIGESPFEQVRDALTRLADAHSERSVLALLCCSSGRARLAVLARVIDPRFRVFGYDGVPVDRRIEVVEPLGGGRLEELDVYPAPAKHASQGFASLDADLSNEVWHGHGFDVRERSA